ncbi:hypothetical protein [Hydrogenovibrio halophilus]|uniref:hypothetical protein n=1 Tax=Hydrogenovibrio halophilus TaxID=373391 RepID=UPI0012FD2082|nr:hypothetical protein [Hydrogenovibrio halophilus]
MAKLIPVLASLDYFRLYASDGHCAFTDLIRFDGIWFCAFREGRTHMSYDGRIRIMSSVDGSNWSVRWTLSWVGGDLRDPHFVVNAQGQLVLNAGIRLAVRVQPRCSFFSAGWRFDSSQQIWLAPVVDRSAACRWRWMPHRHGDFVYTVAYTGQANQGVLARSADGLHWQDWVTPFFPAQRLYFNEATLASRHNLLVCLLRCDQKGGCSAMLGTAKPPFDDWYWQTLHQAIGGPKLITLSDGTLIAVYRVIDYEHELVRLEVAEVDPDRAALIPLGSLPAEGDCSYAGMVEYDRVLWISYYSTPQDDAGLANSQIYLARVPLEYSS